MSPDQPVRKSLGDENMARLAEKLVRRLGMNDALRVCRENSWHGVLRIIQTRRSDDLYT